MAFAWISMLISITLVLVLVGIATLLLVNARSISDYFRENVAVSVVLKTDVPDADAAAFEKALSGKSFVKGTHLISREQGTAEMAGLLGEDFLEAFGETPVPVSIDLKLKPEYVSKDSLEIVKAEIGESPLVDEVVYQSSLVEALNENLNRVSLILAVLTGLLLFISFVLISNTMRLSVFTRRFTVHTMKLVGATKGFIRKPFMGQAAIMGLIAAIIACLIIAGGLFLLREKFYQIFNVFEKTNLMITAAAIVAAGLIICTFSTYVSTNRLLSLSKDELYA
ncbi:MAG: permease-like cell division protein FtsX [Bacteroidales bacterium]|nr:permease-like cell division protein FtsX [Bacteroidales bacterium]